MRKIFFLIAFFLSFGQIAFAYTVFTSDINGSLKQQFYPTDIVYLAPSTTNITVNSTGVTVYIVYDSNSWTNQTALVDVSGSGYKNLTTNATGYLNTTTAIWASSQRTGNYNVVVDVNQNGVYDQGIDVVFNPSLTGFVIVAPPSPTFTVSVGENNPASHNFTIPSSNNDNVMMQVKMTAGSFEDVKITSMSLIGNGTGDDSKGISAIKLVLDSNANGVYDSTENLVGSGKYMRDNGIAQVTVYDGYNIPLNSTTYFLIVYTMSNASSDGDTYSFQLASVEGVGVYNGAEAKETGTPINSAITTISTTLSTTNTTTANSTITTTSTLTTAANVTTATSTASKGLSSYKWIYIAAGVSATIIIFFLVFWLRTTRAVQHEYKPPQ
jgi:hypothetical protein